MIIIKILRGLVLLIFTALIVIPWLWVIANLMG